MPTCSVIQPFDGGKYDKRYEGIYVPAIEAAGLKAYRVDRDPGAVVLIESIEEGIRSAAICLADITTDNPNVWYELGFAFASGKPVVMVCSDERRGNKYPFDIQHRTVIPYKTESPQDFEKLQATITTKLKALLKRENVLSGIRNTEQVAPVHGLTQPELAVLASVAGSVVLPDEGVSVYNAKQDVERSGFTGLGFSIGIRRLREKQFISIENASNNFGDDYQVVVVLKDGWNWIEKNEDKFMLTRPQSPPDDNIPF